MADGADSFFIRDGLVVAQTIHLTVERLVQRFGHHGKEELLVPADVPAPVGCALRGFRS